ncbi:3 beta-hydroxysteroid dehydrogenase/Delta 5--_4-isomerase [Aquimixticola soesokkakensis]|uniref:3 beta-hydroxysteroid dehydrogenase/Delta 5-->4-isomerase n=1 Tax=Aquimixticola soesokkakensis TaxID=1519096 RepID=A0A1Y5RIG5_9RHOB|nr:NAD-dependent epimerase/dehydratase family protein [Aquimixticola soesokkakensis]SLN18304.1 3 beta-hydroxysteroid dehydrogenase/Delta 5-->4-isomerase [Aquimixticola soesokkakensis]
MAQGTILLTGITGFIAKRIALDLLRAGYTVRGSLRSQKRESEVRDTLARHLTDAKALDRLSFVELDLMQDRGWDTAMSGVDAVIHTASPFPLGQPKDESDIIRPAVDGTLRALKAAQAAGVRRVVLTASMESVMHGVLSDPITEADFSDPEADTCSAYTRSKIFAERAAWDFLRAHPDMQLTVINPGLVCGTPMDSHTGSSVNVIKRFFNGKDPMVPDMVLPIVDIDDVALMHVRALSTPASIGKRYIACDSFAPIPTLTRALKAEFPERRIPTRVAPDWMIKLLALIDPQIKLVVKWLGWTPTLSHAAATRDLGVTFTPADTAVLKTARFLARRP